MAITRSVSTSDRRNILESRRKKIIYIIRIHINSMIVKIIIQGIIKPALKVKLKKTVELSALMTLVSSRNMANFTYTLLKYNI